MPPASGHTVTFAKLVPSANNPNPNGASGRGAPNLFAALLSAIACGRIMGSIGNCAMDESAPSCGSIAFMEATCTSPTFFHAACAHAATPSANAHTSALRARAARRAPPTAAESATSSVSVFAPNTRSITPRIPREREAPPVTRIFSKFPIHFVLSRMLFICASTTARILISFEAEAQSKLASIPVAS